MNQKKYVFEKINKITIQKKKLKDLRLIKNKLLQKQKLIIIIIIMYGHKNIIY